MMTLIKSFFGIKRWEDDFSRFFTSAKSAEKKKLLKDVVREANKEQQSTVKKAKQREKTKTA